MLKPPRFANPKTLWPDSLGVARLVSPDCTSAAAAWTQTKGRGLEAYPKVVP